MLGFLLGLLLGVSILLVVAAAGYEIGRTQAVREIEEREARWRDDYNNRRKS